MEIIYKLEAKTNRPVAKHNVEFSGFGGKQRVIDKNGRMNVLVNQ